MQSPCPPAPLPPPQWATATRPAPPTQLVKALRAPAAPSPAPLLPSADLLRSQLPAHAAPLAAAAHALLTPLYLVFAQLCAAGILIDGRILATTQDSAASSPTPPLRLFPLHPCFAPSALPRLSPPLPLAALVPRLALHAHALSPSARLLALPSPDDNRVIVFTINPAAATARPLVALALPAAPSAAPTALAFAHNQPAIAIADSHGGLHVFRLPAPSASSSAPAHAPATLSTSLSLPGPAAAVALQPHTGILAAIVPALHTLPPPQLAHTDRDTVSPATTHGITVSASSPALPPSHLLVYSLPRAALALPIPLPADFFPQRLLITPHTHILVTGLLLTALHLPVPHQHTVLTSTHATAAAALLFTASGSLIASARLPAAVTALAATQQHIFLGTHDAAVLLFTATLRPLATFATYGPPPHLLPYAAHAAANAVARNALCKHNHTACLLCAPDLSALVAHAHPRGVLALLPLPHAHGFLASAALPRPDPSLRHAVVDILTAHPAFAQTHAPAPAPSAPLLPLPPSLLLPAPAPPPVDPALLALTPAAAAHPASFRFLPSPPADTALAAAALTLAQHQLIHLPVTALAEPPAPASTSPTPTHTLASQIAALEPPPPPLPPALLPLASLPLLSAAASLARQDHSTLPAPSLAALLRPTTPLAALAAPKRAPARLLYFPLRTQVPHPLSLGLCARSLADAEVRAQQTQWRTEMEAHLRQRSKMERDLIQRDRDKKDGKKKGIFNWFKN